MSTSHGRNPGVATTPLPSEPTVQQATVEGGTRALLLLSHPDGVVVGVLENDGVAVVVGREPPADLMVPSPSVSRCHARFRREGDVVLVEDLGSTNGIYFRGVRCDECCLRDGEQVGLGSASARLHILDAGAAENLDSAHSIQDHDSLVRGLDKEIDRARYFSRTVALLLLEPVRREDARTWSSLLGEVAKSLRPVDSLAMFGPTTLELLAPELTARDAAALGASIAAKVEGEIRVAVGTYPQDGTRADLILDKARRAMTSPTQNSDTGTLPSAMAQSPAMQKLLRAVDRVARFAVPVLIAGETGSGKEVLARTLHDKSPRRTRPFVAVNCGAIPSQLVESTLFGHERGAFTGAVTQHTGLFEAAQGGTLLLDEVAELPEPVQVALLRVLESKCVVRVGSTREVSIDVRVLAATHRDVDALVARGAFRADLHFRLNAVTLDVPPLRDRAEDLPALARYFVEQACNDHGLEPKHLAAEALAAMASYRWPGNVRELRNMMERALVMSPGSVITLDDLPERVRAQTPHIPGPSAVPMMATASLRESLRDAERGLILNALKQAHWRQAGAAELLEVPVRTLHHKMKSLGIQRLGYGRTLDAQPAAPAKKAERHQTGKNQRARGR